MRKEAEINMYEVATRLPFKVHSDLSEEWVNNDNRNVSQECTVMSQNVVLTSMLNSSSTYQYSFTESVYM